jgi:hypothetical protein
VPPSQVSIEDARDSEQPTDSAVGTHRPNETAPPSV